MLPIVLHAALAEYDKCDRPAGKWAGFDQGIGRTYGQAVVFTNNHVYVGGYGAGEISFGSSTETGDYHDHLGTKTGPNAHDTHLDVTIHHDTASVAALGGSNNANALSSQLGQDSFIYKMDATTGKPSSLYAMDTMPIDGNLYGNGTNGGWGGWSYLRGLDSFDLAGEADVVAAVGMVRGRITFPGTPDQELTNGKNGCYDPWVAKINAATNQVVWATKEKIEIPAPADPEEDCQSAYPGSVVTTAAGHVITSTYSRLPGRKYTGQFTKFNGATGAFVWQKDFGLDLYGSAKMSSAGGEKVIYTGDFKGNNSDVFAPLTSTSCEGGDSKSAAIACFDVSATDAPVADWVVTMCGEASATFVQGDYVYAVGELDNDASSILAHAPSSTAAKCTMTGEHGGYLVKLQKSDGKCVWAKDVPDFSRVVADTNSVWGLKSTSNAVTFDATHTISKKLNRDLIMGKFSASDGTGHWGAAMGGAGSDYAYDMTITPHGPLAVGYSESESTTVGDVTVNNLQQDVENGQRALFVIQLSSTDKKPSCIDQCPSGNINDATIKAGNCYVDDVCIANGAFSPVRTCFRCDSATAQQDLTGPITDNHCYIGDACRARGEGAPTYARYGSNSVCETCDPDKDPDAWSLASGYFHDRDTADQRSSGANNYGIYFAGRANGCQLLPDMPTPSTPSAGLTAANAIGGMFTVAAIGTRTTSAISAVNSAAKGNQGAEIAWGWYHGDSTKCAKDAGKDVCKHTPSELSDTIAPDFETNLYYGHSVARVKVQQALAILQSDLATPSADRSIDDIKKDIVAHMLIPHYQGAIKAAHQMDEGTAIEDTDGAEHWNVIDAAVGSFAASDRAQLAAMFATDASGKLNFCTVQTLLLRNLPGSSKLQYGSKDCIMEGCKEIGTHAPDDGDVQHVTAKDIGVLKASLQADGTKKDCSSAGALAMPPPSPPPAKKLVQGPSEANTESSSESSSGLTDGEIAGVAIGAAIGGIVLLGIVGLILRSLIVKDAKPVFTCLEKGDAIKPS
jgi:hypothetical protein